MNRLALGTAQFGMKYGVANHGGQTSLREAASILARAKGAGIDSLDTAIAYQDSESVLGKIGVKGWNVVTKLPSIPDECTDVREWVQESVEGSIRRLGIDQLGGLLLHCPDQLAGANGAALHAALTELKSGALVKKIGISIYDPSELELLIGKYPLDIVQAPYNLVDRRLTTSGWLNRLNSAGIEVQARSIFLQGLLLMDKEVRPPTFERWPSLWRRWEQWLAESNTVPLKACMQFALSSPKIDRIIIGVDCLAHLDEILLAIDGPVLQYPADLCSDDPDLVNPSRWKRL